MKLHKYQEVSNSTAREEKVKIKRNFVFFNFTKHKSFPHQTLTAHKEWGIHYHITR